MKHGQEEVSLSCSLDKPANKPGRRARSRWSQGRGPGERERTHVPDTARVMRVPEVHCVRTSCPWAVLNQLKGEAVRDNAPTGSVRGATQQWVSYSERRPRIIRQN